MFTNDFNSLQKRQKRNQTIIICIVYRYNYAMNDDIIAIKYGGTYLYGDNFRMAWNQHPQMKQSFTFL